MRHSIKFVKNSNMWCLTIFDDSDKKLKQTSKFFNTKDEAIKESVKEMHEKHSN